MGVIVRRVIKAENHSNADTLRVYEMTDNKTTLQIVANMTNVYDVGDHVLVAEIGSILKEDNLKIKESKIRGITSFGMALGKTDLPIGTNMSDEYCVPANDGIEFSKWPSIESLYNVRKTLKALATERVINYRCKIKLHGTNAAVQIFPNKVVVAQSRTHIITPEDDNNGFAKWVMSKADYWKSLSRENHITVFGEWCGPGVNSGCAIHQISKKIFCIFAIEYTDENGIKTLDVGPSSIECFIKPNNDDIFVIPFMDEEFSLDFTNVDVLFKQTEKLNELCHKVEKCDPYVKNMFKIEGTGEGFVMYPVINNQYMINKLDFSELVIKVKGEEHKVVKTKEPAQIDPEVANSIEEFVKLFVTEPRLEQFANQINDFDMKNTGQFIKIFTQDVHKESVAELEASKLDWKQVAKAVSEAARVWWMDKCKDLG